MLCSLRTFYYIQLYKSFFAFKEILGTFTLTDLQISRGRPTSVIHKYCIEMLFEHNICPAIKVHVPVQLKMQVYTFFVKQTI